MNAYLPRAKAKARAVLSAVKARVVRSVKFMFEHRTKTCGIATGIAGGVENGLAQYGHFVPEHWRGLLLGVAGGTMFLIGLFNSFLI